MKRLLAALTLIIIVAAALAAPYVIGMRVHTLFQRQVERLSAQIGQPIEIVRYERGWLHARAVTRITLDADTTLRIRHRITHGPYAVFGWARIDSSVQANAHSPLSHYFGQRPVLQATTNFAFDGSVHIHAQSPAFHATSRTREQVTIDWGGAQADIRLDQHTLDFHIRLPRLALTGPDGRLSLRGVTLRGSDKRTATNTSKPAASRWQMHGRIKQLVVHRPGNELDARAALQWRIRTRLDAAGTYAADARITLSNARLELPAQLSNKPLTIEHALGHAAISGIARQPLLQLLNALVTRPTPQQDPAHGRQQTRVQLLRQYLPQLLSHHVTLSVAIPEFDSNFGALGLQGHAEIKPVQDTVALSPSRLLRRSSADVRAFIDARLLRRVSGLSATTLARFMVQRHLLDFHAGRFSLRAHFGRDGFTLNGRPALGLLQFLLSN